MCGILLFITKDENQVKVFQEYILPLIENRGPDETSNYSIQVKNTFNETFTLYFVGSVLHLRGKLTKQPKVKEHIGCSDVFLWNGEVFGGSVKVEPYQNDTEVLFNKLQELWNLETSSNHDDMVSLFSNVQGPYSFVYFNGTRKKLWFGRDYFGRRSLLKNASSDAFILSSVGHASFGKEFSEVAAKSVHCIDLENTQYNAIQSSVKCFLIKMAAAFGDSVLAEHRCLKPVMDQFDLNQHGNKSDTTKCESAAYTGDSIPGTSSRLKVCNLDYKESENKMDKICNETDSNTLNAIKKLTELRDEFLKILENSVRTRVCNIPDSSKESSVDKLKNTEFKQSNLGPHQKPKVGILFSGGIDSVVLAALAHRCLPLDAPIDLINVAFAQKIKTPQHVKKKHVKKLMEMGEENESYDVPDRLTGRDALKEMQADRQWNFIEVNVSLEELQNERSSRISNLVYPLDTVLDDSVGCAIWFAARGVGSKYVLKDGALQLCTENYKSPVKVLLCGMGADEQLGGYGRHRTKFEANSWKGLSEEMAMEIARISTRNLGRDDRCISDHGRESRFPFLDENVVAFLQQLPVCVKCDPRYPRGVGEKILLREVAELLGLHNVSKLPKRAIQFGSKIAKMESNKEKGSDSCARLK